MDSACSYQLYFNSVALQGAGSVEICSGVDVPFSLINHSCRPNAHYFGEGRTIRIRSVQPIKQGDEITVTYVPNDPKVDTLGRRRGELSRHYGFWCLCPLCTEQEEDASKSPLSPEQRAQDEKVKRFQKKLNDYLLSVVITDKAQVAGFMKKVKNIQNCMFPNGTWPPNLWPAADIESKLKEAEAGRSLPQEEFIRRFRRNYPGAEKFPVTIAHVDHSLIDKVETLLMYMEEFVAATGGQMKEWEGCPLDLEAFNLVYRGYLRWMCWEADRAYGSDTGFVARCKKRLEEHEALVGKGTDGPGSSEAGGDFMRHQRTLLSWCRIPGDVVFPCSWVLNDTP